MIEGENDISLYFVKEETQLFGEEHKGPYDSKGRKEIDVMNQNKEESGPKQLIL